MSKRGAKRGEGRREVREEIESAHSHSAVDILMLRRENGRETEKDGLKMTRKFERSRMNDRAERD